MDVNSTTRSQLPALHYLADHAEEGYHAHITIYNREGKPVGSEWISPQGAAAVKKIVAADEAYERQLEKTRKRMMKYLLKKSGTPLSAPPLYNRELTIAPVVIQGVDPWTGGYAPSLPRPWGQP